MRLPVSTPRHDSGVCPHIQNCPQAPLRSYWREEPRLGHRSPKSPDRIVIGDSKRLLSRRDFPWEPARRVDVAHPNGGAWLTQDDHWGTGLLYGGLRLGSSSSNIGGCPCFLPISAIHATKKAQTLSLDFVFQDLLGSVGRLFQTTSTPTFARARRRSSGVKGFCISRDAPISTMRWATSPS